MFERDTHRDANAGLLEQLNATLSESILDVFAYLTNLNFVDDRQLGLCRSNPKMDKDELASWTEPGSPIVDHLLKNLDSILGSI